MCNSNLIILYRRDAPKWSSNCRNVLRLSIDQYGKWEKQFHKQIHTQAWILKLSVWLFITLVRITEKEHVLLSKFMKLPSIISLGRKLFILTSISGGRSLQKGFSLQICSCFSRFATQSVEGFCTFLTTGTCESFPSSSFSGLLKRACRNPCKLFRRTHLTKLHNRKL